MSCAPPGPGPLADQRGLLGLLGGIKLLVTLAVVGLVAYEVAAVATARLNAQEVADTAATAAADAHRETGSLDAAHRAATAAIRRINPRVRLVAFEVRTDGGIRLTVRRRARTLLVQHVPVLEGFGVARADGRVDPPRIER